MYDITCVQLFQEISHRENLLKAIKALSNHNNYDECMKLEALEFFKSITLMREKKNRAWITVSLNKKQTFQLNETILTCIGAIDLFEFTRLPLNFSNYLQVRFIFLQVQQLPSHAPRNQFLNRWKMENFQTFYYMNNHSSGYFNDEQNNNDRQSKSIWQFILI